MFIIEVIDKPSYHSTLNKQANYRTFDPKSPPDSHSGPVIPTCIKACPVCVPLTGNAKTFPWKQFQAGCKPPIVQILPVLSIIKQVKTPNNVRSKSGMSEIAWFPK